MAGPTKYTQLASVTADQDAAVSRDGGFVRLMGYAARDADPSGGANSDFQIVDGSTGSGGTMVVPVDVPSNGTENQWFGPEGIEITTGDISINMGSGTADIVLYHRVD